MAESVFSNLAGQDENQDDQHDQADCPARVIAPSSTVWPRGQRTNQHQNKQDDKNRG